MVRSQWRVFRKELHKSIFYPRRFKTYPGNEGFQGAHCILGELEALEGNDIIWVRSCNNHTFTVEMRNSSVYFMPPITSKEKLYPHLLPVPLPATSLEKVSWDDVLTLPEGTKMYISGEMFFENGRNTFRTGGDTPLMVLVYNEDPAHLVSRAIWCGRQSNEFWNFLTPWSLLAGLLLLLILSAYLLQNSADYFLQFLSISVALLPAMLFLPPGVLLFALYKRFWDSARRFRAERDLIKLLKNPDSGDFAPVDRRDKILCSRQPSGWNKTGRFSNRKICLPWGNSDQVICFPETPEILSKYCQRKAFLYEAFSGMGILLGLAINYYLVWVIYKWLF